MDDSAAVLRHTLDRLAPGTELRDGLERILSGRTGALIVLGHERKIQKLCTGGFDVDIAFSPTRLRELAKLDGAIIVDPDITRIYSAGVHLMPNPKIVAIETGTRHRTAERVAKQTGVPVVSVSASMSTVSVYVDEHRHVLEETGVILARANQALQTLERYRHRLEQVTGALAGAELEGLASVRDVAVTLQRQEMLRRIAVEIAHYVRELGTAGRLVDLQLDELTAGDEPDSYRLLHDYLGSGTAFDKADEDIGAATQRLHDLGALDIVDLESIANAVGLAQSNDTLDTAIAPSGERLMARMKLPRSVIERLIARFGELQNLTSADVEDLMQVDGVGERRARAIRDSLDQIAEASALGRSN